MNRTQLAGLYSVTALSRLAGPHTRWFCWQVPAGQVRIGRDAGRVVVS